MVRFATPLFLALVVINIADLVFAVDSVPAIFAITTDTYIVFTANIMAILGLRALYFALAAMVHRFEYLKYALAVVLVFIGAKIFWNQIVGKLDPAISLGVTLSLILAGSCSRSGRPARLRETKPIIAVYRLRLPLSPPEKPFPNNRRRPMTIDVACAPSRVSAEALSSRCVAATPQH